METQEKFKAELLKLPKAPKTLIERLKVHHNEVAMANLLAYFFRPEEKHGLRDLFIQALLNCQFMPLRKEDNDTQFTVSEFKSMNWWNARVRTEKVTGEKRQSEKTEHKRIDIWIESNQAIICIEFKINHELNNPLKEYQEYAEKIAKKKGIDNRLFVVLTPYWKEPTKSYSDDILFRQVIISKFIDQVELLMKNKEIQPMGLQELIQTIQNRKIKMDQEDAVKELFSSNLTLESVRFIDDEYWDEILTKMKLKALANNKEWVYHSDSKGGFVERKKDNEATKIRVVNGAYQIEKWKNGKQELELRTTKPINTRFEELIQ